MTTTKLAWGTPRPGEVSDTDQEMLRRIRTATAELHRLLDGSEGLFDRLRAQDAPAMWYPDDMNPKGGEWGAIGMALDDDVFEGCSGRGLFIDLERLQSWVGVALNEASTPTS